MTSEDKKVVLAFSLVFLFLFLQMLTVCLYSYSKNEQIEEMVKNGADPIRASCAIKDCSSAIFLTLKN